MPHQSLAAAAAAGAGVRQRLAALIVSLTERRAAMSAADVLVDVVESSPGRRWRHDHHRHHHHHHRYQQDEELIEFAQTTSLHGVPRVISARSLIARVFWSVVCLGAFLMFLANSASLLQQYRSYPKKVLCWLSFCFNFSCFFSSTGTVFSNLAGLCFRRPSLVLFSVLLVVFSL